MYAITINLIFHSGLSIPFGYCAFSQFLGEDRESGEGSRAGSELTPAMKYTARSSAARETSPDGRQQSSSWMAMVAPEKTASHYRSGRSVSGSSDCTKWFCHICRMCEQHETNTWTHSRFRVDFWVGRYLGHIIVNEHKNIVIGSYQEVVSLQMLHPWNSTHH